MDERILVPFDGSPLSERALDRAVTRHPGAEITVLYVIDPILAVYDVEAGGLPSAKDWLDRMRERADVVLADAGARADEHDRAVTTAVEVGRPARAILRYVDDHGIDHVVMGSHGRAGASRLVLGSVAETVIRRSPVPVTVVR
ncbi:MAG: universal stress protein [Haloferacaceae archaeon]